MDRLSIFIEKARKRFGNKYDYSLAEYTNGKTKITIICPIHGMFDQKPNIHLTSVEGCPECGKETKQNKINVCLLLKVL